MQKHQILTAVLASSICFASNASSHFEGKYTCAGTEVGTKQNFTCEMTIKQTGETYSSKASCSDGNSYSGTGIYDKETHHLSTAFINPKKSEETGVSVSVIKSNGNIVSVWTYLDKTTTAQTKCSLLSKVAKAE